MITLGLCLDQHQKAISDEGHPNLIVYGIFTRSVKSFNLEVLLGPLEKQFNLPALAIQFTQLFSTIMILIIGDQLNEIPFTVSCFNQAKCMFHLILGVA